MPLEPSFRLIVAFIGCITIAWAANGESGMKNKLFAALLIFFSLNFYNVTKSEEMSAEDLAKAMNHRAASLALGEQSKENIWEYAPWSGYMQSEASVTTTSAASEVSRLSINISCRNENGEWRIERIGLNYLIQGDSYGLDLAGSGPQGRPAALLIDGVTYDNANIDPDTEQYEEYKNEIYKAISNSKSQHIDLEFKDHRVSGVVRARFSNFQKNETLTMMNRDCPYK